MFVGGESGRDIKDCIIVDNSIYCFQRNITNGIQIPKFTDIENDNWLPLLKKYLIEKFVINKNGKSKLNVDVRAKIAKDYNFEAITNLSRVAQIK